MPVPSLENEISEHYYQSLQAFQKLSAQFLLWFQLDVESIGFNTGIPAFNVTLFPPDQFSQTTLEVNKNDNVTVNFFNMEAPYGDRHSFTINAPYKINLDLAPGQNGTLSFLANHPGIYQFYCAYHEPTMTGQLLVIASK